MEKTSFEYLESTNEQNRSIKSIIGTKFNAYLFYANNAGRGKNNVTVCICKKNHVRANCVKNQTGVIKQYQVCAWKGVSNNPVDPYLIGV